MTARNHVILEQSEEDLLAPKSAWGILFSRDAASRMTQWYRPTHQIPRMRSEWQT